MRQIYVCSTNKMLVGNKQLFTLLCHVFNYLNYNNELTLTSCTCSYLLSEHLTYFPLFILSLQMT